MRLSRRPSSILPAAAALGLVLLVPTLVVLVPRSGTVAILGPPRGGAAEAARIVAAAGGTILASGRPANLLVATSAEPGFARRLYAAGAWLVVHPLLAGACAPSPPPSSDPSPR